MHVIGTWVESQTSTGEKANPTKEGQRLSKNPKVRGGYDNHLSTVLPLRIVIEKNGVTVSNN